MNLIVTCNHWKDWVDWISTRPDKILQPEKCTFWEKTHKLKNITISSDNNGSRTHNHLDRKGSLNHLAKLAKKLFKWLNCVVSTYLYGAFDCMLLSCRVCVWMIVVMSRKPLNCWVIVYELSGCGFKSRCCHLNFRYCTCFEQGVLWHSGN